VERSLAGRPPIELIPGAVLIRYRTNPGGAFGLFGGSPVLFLVATALAVGAIALSSRRLETRSAAIGLGLILGGALGNLTDRLVRGDGISGTVVDFVDLRVWPVFNVADTAIVVGAAIVLIGSFRHRREPSRSTGGQGGAAVRASESERRDLRTPRSEGARRRRGPSE
jgi:signal peptidase II